MLDASYAFPMIKHGMLLRPMTSSSVGLLEENGESHCINVGSNSVIFIILHLFKMQSQTAIIKQSFPLYFISNTVSKDKEISETITKN